ncbi:MAG: hypothetical protein WBH57_12765 [Anaerolineae bacterium]
MAEVIPDTDSVEVAKIGFAHWVVARVDNAWSMEDYKGVTGPESHADKLLELFDKAYRAAKKSIE